MQDKLKNINKKPHFLATQLLKDQSKEEFKLLNNVNLKKKSKLLKDTKKGTLYWITGLAGAGKTSIGKILYKHIKKKFKNTIFLDGDVLRAVLGYEYINYDKTSRKNVAMKYSRLSKLFTDQGINVIFATISMFDSVRAWNRKNIDNYVEIYLKVPIDKLISRDKKQLFSNAIKKEKQNVVGIDIKIEEPKSPDIILENNEQVNIDNLSADLINKLISDYNL
tara:strand:- start:188 stop:853 length:666 start_codon:yes stop_codon:yes gene_type:complete